MVLLYRIFRLRPLALRIDDQRQHAAMTQPTVGHPTDNQAPLGRLLKTTHSAATMWLGNINAIPIVVFANAYGVRSPTADTLRR